MTCEPSWNLGLWRGEHRCTRDMPLAGWVDRPSYVAGYSYGRDRAATREARREDRRPFDGDRARRPQDPRNGNRRQTWAPPAHRRAA